MAKTAQILCGIALWGTFVIFISYMYTFDALVVHGVTQSDGSIAYNEVEKSLWDVVSGLTIKELESIKYHGLNLRGLSCHYEDNTFQCVDSTLGTSCPSHVDPVFLSLADQQGPCQPAPESSTYCTVNCGEDGRVSWRAHSKSWCKEHSEETACASDVTCCPPEPQMLPYDRLIERRQVPEDIGDDETFERKQPVEHESEPEPQPTELGLNDFLQPFNGQNELPEQDLKKLIKYGFNTRGLTCQHLNGKVVCYRQDNQAREQCPDWVTPAFLSLANGQYACLPENNDHHYCTALCQQGSDEVKWNAHEKAWCKQHRDQCPPENYYVPINEYTTPEYEELKKGKIAGKCTGGAGWALGGDSVKFAPELTVGILANGETKSLKDALTTWAEGGLLEGVGEVRVYLNSRNPEIEKAVAPYTQSPYNVIVMGDSQNYGITNAINWLAGNASTPYFLFLEKDFQLIENRECLAEQLTEGINLLKKNKAQLIKFRSRRHPGFPNWVDNYYRGHEDDCLTSRQPNLFCNVYHWVETPHIRWPKHFWICDPQENADDNTPLFYCSDAEFCNWTNNPIMFEVEWWMREYINDRFKREMHGNDPFVHLEGYMNWEKGSWNHEGWTVAQGEGLFTHRDRNNFGS
eukprot:c14272_g1_i1.p1 GENE.c14272_g1_i1~~c14272_g1_i1.p1  ORF type:complete len:649 (+),score=124.11 c14272_g1_i1:51-1949(+)